MILSLVQNGGQVGAPRILVYSSGDWDVHRGYDLDFDPWPNDCGRTMVAGPISRLGWAPVLGRPLLGA